MPHSTRRLTDYAACAGCAAKLAAGDLARAIGDLPLQADPRVLVDYRTSDDAGVYELDETRALVQTVDFFPPIVDDPRLFGQIAAANALSDVYAMGGTPLTALAIAAFPKDADPALLTEIFAGGLDKLREAGAALLGGHTIQDAEIKFGYAVTGEIDPRRVLTNAGAREGDDLILTKPLGTGIISTAAKFERAPPAALDGAVRSMTTLNRAAARVIGTEPAESVHACTDVTGFGLMGHATEMAVASRCTMEIDASAVPLLGGVLELVSGNISGGGRSNARHFGPDVSLASSVPEALAAVLFDPQTSGGLLLSIDPRRSAALVAALGDEGIRAARIGVVAGQETARILVR